jgi:hypothetical protein
MTLEQKIFNWALGMILFTAFMVLTSSCSGFDPYASLQAPTATAPVVTTVTPSPLPHYWQLAAGDPWQVVSNSTAEHSDLKGAIK